MKTFNPKVTFFFRFVGWLLVAFLASTLCAAADNSESAEFGSATADQAVELNISGTAATRTVTPSLKSPIAPDNRPALSGRGDFSEPIDDGGTTNGDGGLPP
jgi:hypothetical protein